MTDRRRAPRATAPPYVRRCDRSPRNLRAACRRICRDPPQRAARSSSARARLRRRWRGRFEDALAGVRSPASSSHATVTRCRAASIEIVEAAHPVPDAAGLAAARRIRRRRRGSGSDDLVVALISGGGSALLRASGDGLTLDDKQDVNRALLKSGATISEMNCVRRHLSAIKGGRLAAACHPARVVTLLMSDVPGDNPIDIASGPTVAGSDDVRRRAGSPAPVRDRCTCQRVSRSRFRRRRNGQARRSAAREHRNADDRHAAAWRSKRRRAPLATPASRPLILGDSIEGEARDVGNGDGGNRADKSPCIESRSRRPAFCFPAARPPSPCAATGRGGRNVEFLLSLAIALDGRPGVYAIAGDTDGVDGQEDIAGAIVTPDTLARAWSKGIRPRQQPRRQRRPRIFRRAWRLGGHRSDAHQRQRFPGDSRDRKRRHPMSTARPSQGAKLPLWGQRSGDSERRDSDALRRRA